MNRRVDLGQAKQPLEATYSRDEVMAYLGIGSSKLHELLQHGLKFKGPHPLQGGLWPWFKPSHKNVRITKTAIDRHLRHVERLENDAMYRAEMTAKARAIGQEHTRAKRYFAARKDHAA